MQVVRSEDGKVQQFTMRRPSNFHAHFRQGPMMHAVAKHIMRHNRYVLAMPNTGPILTIEEARNYYIELMRIAIGERFHPFDLIMTVYLTEKVTPKVIEQMAGSQIPLAVKYYPPHPGATTGSGLGIPLDRCGETLRAMEEYGIRLLGHFEEVYDKDGRELPEEAREAYMVNTVLYKFWDTYPRLLKCFEHASTKEAVALVKSDETGHSFMTVTPQHSLFIHPDLEWLGHELDCMPTEKSPEDRATILEFITSGDPRVGAGDDTAPHPHTAKLNGAKGCWTPHAIELYAEAFDSMDALDKRFERFMSLNAPRWWNLPWPRADDTITMVREKTPLPPPIRVPELDDEVVPLGWSEKGDLFELNFRIV